MMRDDSIGSLSAIFQKVKKMLHIGKDILLTADVKGINHPILPQPMQNVVAS